MMRSLPLFTQFALQHTAYSLGGHGEIIAKKLLEQRGYLVDTKGAQHIGHDLTAISTETGELFRVEVKTARQNSRRQWCFTMRKRDKYGYANHLNSDVVLLLAVTKSGAYVPFVIPVADVKHIRAITIPTHPKNYAGKYAVYRQRPHEITLEGAPCR